MKIVYKLYFAGLAFLVNTASAQIQKINFPLSGHKSIGIARLSPVPASASIFRLAIPKI